MIVRNKAAVLISQANKNKKQVAYERSSEDGKFDPDHTDLKTNGVISNGINGNQTDSIYIDMPKILIKQTYKKTQWYY